MSNNNFTAKFLYSCPKFSLMKFLGPEVAFIGRSNSGKSTLINKLVKKSLAKTSKTPGRTRHAVVFKGQVDTADGNQNKEFFLVDLPGYGYAKMPKTEAALAQELVSDYLALGDNLIRLFLLMDVRRDLDERENSIIASCQKRNIPVTLVLTKCDKISKSKVLPRVHHISKASGLNLENIVPYSSLQSYSEQKIRDMVLETVW